MSRRLIARRSIVGAALLAVAGVLVSQFAAGPVAAKKLITACQDKHGSCVRRCIERYEKVEDAFRCSSRTCDKQFDNCVKDSGGGSANKTGGKIAVPPVRDPAGGPVRGPFSTGILGSSHGFANQGPAPAGSPAAAPAAPSGGGVIR